MGLTRRDAIRAVGAALPLTAATSVGRTDPSAKRYVILACGGGGVRGLLTARLIKDLDRATGFLKKVDLFAGTSTGGIISLGLAGGVGIDPLLELYRTQVRAIFHQAELPPAQWVTGNAMVKLLQAFFQRIKPDADLGERSPEKLLAVKYENGGLLKAINSVFPTNPLLSELTRSVLVTTFRLDSQDRGWSPVTLHNLPGQVAPPVRTRVVEAAMCTSAAPTYFEPYRHAELGYCVDGGLFANSPGGLAASAAVRAGNEIKSISLLSVGTGGLVARYPFDRMGLPIRYLGIASWMWPKASKRHNAPAMPLLTAMFDGSEVSDQMVCEGLLGARYQRVQVLLKEAIELDDVEAGPKLEEAADEYTKTEGWKTIVRWAEQQ